MTTPHIRCAGGIVRDPVGRLLMVQRGRPPGAGLWSIPGGKCLPGETSAAACIREVHEETGVRVTVRRLAGRVELPAPRGVFVVDDYVCDLQPGDSPVVPVPVAGDDAADARWVSRSDLLALPLTDGLWSALAQWDILPQ